MIQIKYALNILLASVLFLVIISCETKTQKADLIITNATIWTGNERQPLAEAMAISGDTILAVGSSEEIAKFKGGNTRETDAAGKFITPGFIDAHAHLLDGGFNLSSVKLRDSKSPEEFSQRIGDFAKTVPEGTWILGGEWDGSEWGILPSKDWIDKLTPNHPVFVTRLDGHMALANSLAIKLAGIDDGVADVAGGVMLRNSARELTGIFKDNSMTLITSKIPAPTDEQVDRAIDDAMKYFASNGVTSVHHVWYPTDSEGRKEGFERAYKSSRMLTRIFSLGSLEKWKERADQIENEGVGDKWLKINGLKGVFDGALGSHTAAFMDPFTDTPKDRGLFMFPEADLYDWVSNADNAELQIAVHAIGDRAINTLLNTYEKVQLENGAKDRRFRIEHVQHIAPKDISRFAELGVIASMQPYHAIDDGRWAINLIGAERIKTTYAFKSLLDAKAIVAFGSDWPVAPATPLQGIYAAVTRRTLDDKNPDGWVPEQKITVEQALIAYTKSGAFASFEEDIKGTLEQGKLADFVIIDEDITKVDPIKIRDLKVLQTYVGGKKVFDRKEISN
ncbi:MAG: amidohydrolase [Bacteroidia bacterium]|nr:amidohydrolase [Bacteroidia bacterium]